MTDQSGTCSERHTATRIADIAPQRLADVSGVIISATAMSIGGAPACRYTLTDGTGELDLLFLGRVEIAGMRCGRRCRARGRAGKRDDRLVLWNPRYWLTATGAESPDVLVVDDDNASRTAALAAGATDYLLKPFAMAALLGKIR